MDLSWEQQRCGTKQGFGLWKGLCISVCMARIKIGELQKPKIIKKQPKLNKFLSYLNTCFKILSNFILDYIVQINASLFSQNATPSVTLVQLYKNQVNSRQIDLQSNYPRLLCQPMHGLIDSDSDRPPLSPSAFIADLSPHMQLQLQETFEKGLTQMEGCSIEEGTFGSEKSARKKLAGLKSREKKKRQLETLEESVKHLSTEIQTCQREISNCKDQLVEALRTAASTASEHSFTFAELERATHSADDLDRVNLLLDLIQNRIGANARERQARLDYNFKQIINSLFPAMHRYLMHAATNHKDVFGEGDYNDWTAAFYQEVKLSDKQKEAFTRRRADFMGKRRATLRLIKKLKTAKEQMKCQQDIFQGAMTHFREEMNPIQSAKMILCGENNKLRKEFSMFCDQFTYAPKQ